MIIDATNLIMGRIATVAAKKAMLGEDISIINCEKAVITGTKQRVLSDFKAKIGRGIPLKGPYYPRMPDRMMRRTIRGMLPYKQDKGRNAFKRVMCYIGIPESLKGKKAETIKQADVSKVPHLKYVSLGELSRLLGAKHG